MVIAWYIFRISNLFLLFFLNRKGGAKLTLNTVLNTIPSILLTGYLYLSRGIFLHQALSLKLRKVCNMLVCDRTQSEFHRFDCTKLLSVVYLKKGKKINKLTLDSVCLILCIHTTVLQSLLPFCC